MQQVKNIRTLVTRFDKLQKNTIKSLATEITNSYQSLYPHSFHLNFPFSFFFAEKSVQNGILGNAEVCTPSMSNSFKAQIYSFFSKSTKVGFIKRTSYFVECLCINL